jgi:hypothetical protein
MYSLEIKLSDKKGWQKTLVQRTQSLSFAKTEAKGLSRHHKQAEFRISSYGKVLYSCRADHPNRMRWERVVSLRQLENMERKRRERWAAEDSAFGIKRDA